jgi:membrane protease YdiL (CAAX protease family)
MTAVLPPPSGSPREIAPPKSRWDVVPPNAVRWGIPDAIVVLLLFPVALGLGIGFLVLFPTASGVPFSFIHASLSYLLLLGAIIVVSRWRGQRSLRKDFGLEFRWIDLPIGIGLALLGKIASIVFGIFAFVVTGRMPEGPNFEVTPDLVGILLTGILVATLLGPIVEELLLRGLVLRAVRYSIVRGRHHARPQPAPRNIQVRAVVVAILVNSALFALLHLYQAPGDPALFITLAAGTLTVGILHSIITIVTGRLGAAIISHILFNGSSVVLQVALAPLLGN